MRIRKTVRTPSLSGGISCSDKVGMIKWYAGETAPEGYFFCDGREINRVKYKGLFDIIGTTYGSGDGSTTFNLPNIQGRSIVGFEDGVFGLGDKGGEKEHTLTVNEIPSHSHTSGNLSDGFVAHKTSSTDTFSAVYTKGSVGDVIQFRQPANTGGSQPHNNMSPYIVLHAVIKAYDETPITSNVVDTLESNSTTDSLSANQGAILSQQLTQLSYQVTDIENRLPIIEAGTIEATQFTADNRAGSKAYYILKFKKTYTKAPNVVVSYYNNVPSSYGWVRFSVGDIDIEGCTIFCDTDVHALNAMGVQYLVIGE